MRKGGRKEWGEGILGGGGLNGGGSGLGGSEIDGSSAHCILAHHPLATLLDLSQLNIWCKSKTPHRDSLECYIV